MALVRSSSGALLHFSFLASALGAQYVARGFSTMGVEPPASSVNIGRFRHMKKEQLFIYIHI